MRKHLKIAAMAGAMLAGALMAVPVLAQAGTQASGIVVGVDTDANGRLTRFAVSDSGGNVTTFQVQDTTEFGLENHAGDRWTASLADEPAEAAIRLRDNQQRFAPVTVSSRDGVANLVVAFEESQLETNLGFLFAVFAVTWAAFFAYIFFISRKQRELQREIARLQGAIEVNGDE